MEHWIIFYHEIDVSPKFGGVQHKMIFYLTIFFFCFSFLLLGVMHISRKIIFALFVANMKYIGNSIFSHKLYTQKQIEYYWLM